MMSIVRVIQALLHNELFVDPNICYFRGAEVDRRAEKLAQELHKEMQEYAAEIRANELKNE